MAYRVLLVEDDRELRTTLRDALSVEGYEVHAAASLADARALLHHRMAAAQTARHAAPHAAPHATPRATPHATLHTSAARDDPGVDIVLLDLGLPDGDGQSLMAELASRHGVALLVITARDDDARKVALLDGGADDYLVKPFAVAELLARMRVALRHRGAQVAPALTTYAHGDLHVELATRRVERGGAAVHLTPTEFKLLARLVRSAGRVVTHRQLLADVWGAEFTLHTHYLRLYMGQLRAKLEADTADPQHLLTEPGIGYRLVEPA